MLLRRGWLCALLNNHFNLTLDNIPLVSAKRNKYIIFSRKYIPKAHTILVDVIRRPSYPLEAGNTAGFGLFRVDRCSIHIKKALPFCRAFRFSSIVVCLAGNYIRRTWTFFALSDFKLNLLSFIERCITTGFNL